MKVKALSVKQPWAWLIIHGDKNIENRTWKTNCRGPLAIHASKSWDQEGYERLLEDDPEILLPNHKYKKYKFGGIIGLCNLEDILPNNTKYSCCNWHEKGFFGWYLTDRRPLPFKAVRGRQGLFEVEI